MFRSWLCVLVLVNAFGWSGTMAQGREGADSLRFEAIDAQLPTLIGSDPDSVRQLIREQSRIVARGALSEAARLDFHPRYLNNWGVYHRVRTDLDSALYYYQQSSLVQDSAANPGRKATLFNNIANVYFQRGDFPLALDHHFKALSIREAIPDSAGIMMSQANIGLLYENLGESDEALDHYHLALAIAEEQADTNVLGWLYTSLGTLNLTEKKLGAAEDYLRKSKALKATMGDLRGLSFNLTNLGAVYLQYYLHTPAPAFMDSSRMFLRAAEQVQLAQKNDYGLAATWNYLGEAALELGAYAAALDHLEAADSLTLRHNHLQERVRTLELLSRTHQAAQAYRLALSYHQQFKALSDTLFNAERDKEIGRKEAWLTYQQELQADRLRYEGEEALQEVERKRQRLVLVVTALSLGLALLLLAWLYQQWSRARRGRAQAESEKDLLSEEKQQLADQNRQLHSKIVEVQAKLEDSREELPSHLEELTRREMEVLLSLGLGLTDREIADRLFISVATVRTHNRRIFEKLSIRSRAEAAALVHTYRLV